MQGDVPLAVYSFEYFAIKEGRLKVLIRPAIDGTEFDEGCILNFAGNRFRVTTQWPVHAKEMSEVEAVSAGFKPFVPVPGDGEPMTCLDKLKRWLTQIGSDEFLWLYELEPLERESNEPIPS